MQIFYKNSKETPDPSYIPGCGTLCPLSKMYELLDDILPKDDFNTECQRDDWAFQYSNISITSIIKKFNILWTRYKFCKDSTISISYNRSRCILSKHCGYISLLQITDFCDSTSLIGRSNCIETSEEKSNTTIYRLSWDKIQNYWRLSR